MVKNLPAMQGTWVLSLGWKDSLDKGMATHSKYSCPKNSMDRGAWWATVHGVAKTNTFTFFSSTIRRAIYFTHFTDSNGEIIWHTLTDTLRNNV